MSGEVNHDYHLVNPSPWPAVASVAMLFVAIGAVFSMKPDAELFGIVGQNFGNWFFFGGMALLLITAFQWWKDVISEAHGGDHTPVVQIGLRYGMIFFIASEVMFFVAWFWAFFNAALFPPAMVDDPSIVWQLADLEWTWPPAGIEVLDPWHLPLINTLILLLSGTTVTWAHHALIEGDRSGLKKGLWATVILGALFTSIQVYEYGHATFGFADGIYSSTFYMATGFHGAHVLIGTIFLLVCLVRAYKGHFKPEQHFGFEAAAWYWHFVDVVWIFLFFCIYIWGSIEKTGIAHY